jgi:MoaA/NifB/PqqE/SkfB family radical SAM enzyme
MQIKRLDLKVGFACNNYCKFCVQGNKRKSCFFKDKELLKRKIEESHKICNEIVFTGGEPTLHKDLFELIEFAKKLGYSNIQIQSNGRMFAYLDFCKEVIKRGATEFSIALHGHLPSLHDWLTSVKGSFYQTVKGICNLKSLNQRVITNTVITKSNFRHLPQIAKLLIDLGVDQYQFAFPHALGRAKENFHSIIPRKKMVISYVKEGLQVGRIYKIMGYTEAIPYCFMQGYWEHISERIIPPTKIVDLDKEIENYEEVRVKEGKKKGRICRDCKLYSLCEGPWKEYPENFGWEEFKPIK